MVTSPVLAGASFTAATLWDSEAATGVVPSLTVTRTVLEEPEERTPNEAGRIS